MPPRLKFSSRYICDPCRHSLAQRAASTRKSLSVSARVPARPKSNQSDLDDYYALLLADPLPTSAARQRPQYSPPSSKPDTTSVPTKAAAFKPPPPPPPTDPAARARLVFGSRDAGPAERAKRKEERDAVASVVAGIRIPPRPDEPDNCCMSGCVNCVWDLYREELEEWAEKRQAAELKMRGEGLGEGLQRVTGGGMAEGPIGMDDDGGGSETNWDLTDARLPKGKGLFDSVPVGIREFMRTEKRLGKRREERAATSAALED